MHRYSPTVKRCLKRTGISPTFLRFINLTSDYALVYILNSMGLRKYYDKISPGGHLDVNTYTADVWMFDNGSTGDPLSGGGSIVFSANGGELFYEPCLYSPRTITVIIRRINVQIRKPLCTLKTRALQVVRDMLSAPEDVRHLEIPDSIKSDLAVLCMKKLCITQHKANCNCVL